MSWWTPEGWIRPSGRVAPAPCAARDGRGRGSAWVVFLVAGCYLAARSARPLWSATAWSPDPEGDRGRLLGVRPARPLVLGLKDGTLVGYQTAGPEGKGSWFFSLALPRRVSEYGTPIRRGGYASREEAVRALKRLQVTGGRVLPAADWPETRLASRVNVREEKPRG